MLSNLFLGLSMVGAEWVLYLLVVMSVISVAIMIERSGYFRKASKGSVDFRSSFRAAVTRGDWNEAIKLLESRPIHDLESAIAKSLLQARQSQSPLSSEVLTELATDSVVRTRIQWEKNLAILATIGSNAPFIGLFGTVLGIIKAFHDLANQSANSGGVQTVMAGISEALVATAIGLLVAIPAVMAFNLFQRKVRTATSEAEALKSFLIGKLVK